MKKNSKPPLGPKLLKLNLGCGEAKINGFTNIDTETACKPDLVCNFVLKKLPFLDSSVDEIVMFHTIEHIRKVYHKRILLDFWRLLKPNGTLVMSFPEFSRCYKNWSTNYQGKKEFWEHTMFGRQLYPSDYHVCAMDSGEFSDLLKDCGFIDLNISKEPKEAHNTILFTRKGAKPPNYEDLLREHMTNVKFEKVVGAGGGAGR